MQVNLIGTSIKHNYEFQKTNMVGLMQIMYYYSAIKLENTFYCIWLIPISKDLNELQKIKAVEEVNILFICTHLHVHTPGMYIVFIIRYVRIMLLLYSLLLKSC